MIQFADIVCGLAWGDEAKGKITSQLASSNEYDYVCRWAGGNNAGHTVYVNRKKYKTHLIPSGVFYNIKSVIGPGCVINKQSFFAEIEYLKNAGFDTSLVKVSPKTHIVLDKHLLEDFNLAYKRLGTTAKGIGPCYSDKSKRVGLRVEDDPDFKNYIWDETLQGKILCEGAQGFWLDLDRGNYPYVTSSNTLPYSACSLGFPPQKIRKIYGAAKIYDTRSGYDPDFPESLLEEKELKLLSEIGEEFGVTTGRKRKSNWLNLDKLIVAINESGTTDLIISKTDVMEKAGYFKLFFNEKINVFNSLEEIKTFITNKIREECLLVSEIYFSNSPYNFI